MPGQYAAKAAVDIALHDWAGQKLGTPVYRLFGLDPSDTPVTTFSIGIDTPEVTREKVREAAPFPVLKIKVGLDTDEPTLEAVRSVTKKPLRVDANEGWKDKDLALRRIKWLETQNVELIEQPMPAAMLDEQRWLHSRVSMPIFADESCLRLADIPRIAGAYDGINVKVDKAGGLLAALRMIDAARAHDLKVMLGCMVSSSVAITAAAHLSPLVDYADLDGNLLVSNDPYSGVTVKEGKLVLPDGPGLGLTPARLPDGSSQDEWHEAAQDPEEKRCYRKSPGRTPRRRASSIRRPLLEPVGEGVQRRHTPAVHVQVQARAVEEDRLDAGGAGAPHVRLVQVPDMHRRLRTGIHPRRASSKNRGSGFSTFSSQESSTMSTSGRRPMRSKSARTVPFAFETTARRSPSARIRRSASGTSSGMLSQRFWRSWYSRTSRSAASVPSEN